MDQFINRRFTAALFIIGVVSFSQSWALGRGGMAPVDTCADQTKPAGVFRFDDAYSGEMQFCDGTAWQSMSAGQQVNPCTANGAQRFNSGEMQFCDGTNWHTMDKGATTTACTLAGAQIRTESEGVYYCDGSVWHGLIDNSGGVNIACFEFKSSRNCTPVTNCSWISGTCYDNNDCATRTSLSTCNANPTCVWVAGVCGSAL